MFHSPTNNNGIKNHKRPRTNDSVSSDNNVDGALIDESINLIKKLDSSSDTSNDVLYQVLMNNNEKLHEMHKMMIYLIDENAAVKSELELIKITHDDALKELKDLKARLNANFPTNNVLTSDVNKLQRSLNFGSIKDHILPVQSAVKPEVMSYASVTKARPSGSVVVVKPKERKIQ